eukprot:scaffold1401_cov330-Pavlova_lutheri.AAC.82
MGSTNGTRTHPLAIGSIVAVPTSAFSVGGERDRRSPPCTVVAQGPERGKPRRLASPYVEAHVGRCLVARRD